MDRPRPDSATDAFGAPSRAGAVARLPLAGGAGPGNCAWRRSPESGSIGAGNSTASPTRTESCAFRPRLANCPQSDRLRSLLAAAYGAEWSAAKEQELLAAGAGRQGKQPRSLDEWLRDRFFAEHCKLFNKRPFIWHIWDGRKRRLSRSGQLPPPQWPGRRRPADTGGACLPPSRRVDRPSAGSAEPGRGRRRRPPRRRPGSPTPVDVLILEGEPPYDLFVRWRPLHEQPLGWAPNLDDGVRLNIRPFMRAELQSGGRKGAGILRVKPNIKWSKDRGKEPESLRPREDFPWFYSCPGQGSEADRTDYAASPEAAYDGARWNDLHYTRAGKEAARERRRNETGAALVMPLEGGEGRGVG